MAAVVPSFLRAQHAVATVVIATEFGDIEVELKPGRAPRTVANFLRYVNEEQYDGGRFHRTVTLDNQPQNQVKIEVIQGSVNPALTDGRYPPNSGHAPIALERTSETGLRHLDGTISMARLGPDTATSGFFICIGNQPELDYGGRRNPDGQGFAAFGRVVRGMDVVRAIQAAPHRGQHLVPPVAVERMFLKE